MNGETTSAKGGIDLFGPSVEFLTSPQEVQGAFCALCGTIPPGISVPLHSHPDAEVFFVISGVVEAFRQSAQGYERILCQAGDFISISSSARHGWRNPSRAPAIVLIVTTPKLAQFLMDGGRPIAAASHPPTSEDLARFAAISAEYGYWNATPEENAAVGIGL